jgi:hypothetical protein
MSRGSFDELARQLARPMRRRGAMRVFGAALVGAAVPALRPSSSVAQEGSGCAQPGLCEKGTVCGFEVTFASGAVGCNKGCCQNTGDPVWDRAHAVCCNFDESGSWCCPEGYRCGSGANTPGDPNCRCTKAQLPDGSCGCPPKERECGERCCPKHRACCTGSSLSPRCCDPGDVCAPKVGSGPTGEMLGKPCCPPGRLIFDGHYRRACCPTGTVATGGSAGGNAARPDADCCRPGDPHCCANVRCKRNEVCVGGRCVKHVDQSSPPERPRRGR